MTLTNHVRDIQTFAHDVQHHADRREYRQAHSVLDDIATRVHALHRHIDHLQNLRDFALNPEIVQDKPPKPSLGENTG